MSKHLYFICPTDHLETVINKAFGQENYYCSSLGNSMLFDADQMGEINGLIEVNNIKQITFILADNNRMILDVLKNQQFSDIRGLANFYDSITIQKIYSKVLWQSDNVRIPILSHYLNGKLEELRSKLSNWLVDDITMDAKIYNTQRNLFHKVYVELISLETYNLN